MENEAVSRNLFDDIEGGSQAQGGSNNFGKVEPEPIQQQSLEEPGAGTPGAGTPGAVEPSGQSEPEVQTEVRYELEPGSVVPGYAPEPQVIKKTQKELNFELLREKNERLKLENDAALNRLKQYEDAARVQAKSVPVPKKQAYTPFDGSDDDLIEGRHVKGLYDEQKLLRQDLASYKKQLKATSDEARFRAQYANVDKVLSPENIAKLGREEPELAATLSASPDFYTQAVSTYKMVKKLGIYVEDNYSAERELAQRNINKPKPLASVAPQGGNSPLNMANAFANGSPSKEALKAAYAEMEKCRKGYL